MSGKVTISGDNLSLTLLLPERGMPEIIAFGTSANDADLLPARASRINGMDVSVPSAVLLPTGGMGFFGWPAIAGHSHWRNFITRFEGWNAETSGGVTVLRATDPIVDLSIAITLSLEGDVLTSSVTLRYDGWGGIYTLDRCMAGSMVIGAGDTTLTSLTGMWGREFHQQTERLGTGLWMQESRRGRTSHDRSPTLVLTSGSETLALHLGWSGNHVIAVDLLDDGRRLVHAGELFEPGEMSLVRGVPYKSPTLYIARDPALIRKRLAALMTWPGGEMKPRPVTLNTWEGNYFDHRMDSLKAQADAAAALGIERFVLDDGWFGRRDDDTTSLGDWWIDERKYPQGLKPLVDHVTSLGMEFGIWFEPEMVNPVSDLYRAHPDWVLQVEGRPLLLSRNQLVLDLTRPEVSDYLFERIDAVLKDHAISYIKWDMNRDLTHAGNRTGRAATGQQTRAVYALMDRVRAAHPHVEIESCASGGGRADYGVLARTHRVWTSDCTDALERLEIQRGARMFLPPEIMGAHISASPNHQTNRRHTLAFRAIVALAYHMGVELNPLSLSDEERSELKDWIALHKQLRPVLHNNYEFHNDPQDGRYVWGAFSKDRAVIIVAQSSQMMSEQAPPLVIRGVQQFQGRWRIAACHPKRPDFIRITPEQQRLLDGEISFSHASLTDYGLPLPMLRPESGLVLELEPVEGA